MSSHIQEIKKDKLELIKTALDRYPDEKINLVIPMLEKIKDYKEKNNGIVFVKKYCKYCILNKTLNNNNKNTIKMKI